MNARSVESLETDKGAQKKVEAKRFWFCQISHILPNSLLPLRRRKNHFFLPEKEKRKPSIYWVLCVGFLSVCEAADTTLLSLLLLLCVQRLGDGVAFFFVNNFWHPFHSPLFVFQLCAAEHSRSLSLSLTRSLWLSSLDSQQQLQFSGVGQIYMHIFITQIQSFEIAICCV